MAQLDKAWERTQKKTFTAWVNSHLRKVGTNIEEIGTDFSDGIKLAQLLSVIAGDNVEKLNKKPTMRIHKIQNTGQCLKFIADKGVKLVGIAPEELVDGNLKMVLGMVWTIILRFQIQDISVEELSAKEGLLLWCQRKTEGYAHVKVSNFHTSFQDGLAFCALIHRHRPDLLDFSKLDPADKAGNLQLAFDVADRDLDIPKMLDVSDMLDVPKPDERSVMTYIAAYFHVFSASQKAETAAKRVAKLLEFTEANTQAKNDYEKRANELVDWINQTITKHEDRNFGDSVDSIQQQLDAFKDYKTNEKPPKATELGDLESSFNALQAKLRLNNRPSFTPSEGLSPQELDALWLKLEKAEQDRAEALRAALRRQRKLDYLLQKYNVKLAKLTDWTAQEDSYLANAEVGQTLTIIQAQLKNLEAFQGEYQSVGSTFDNDTNDILAKLEELEYNDMDTLRSRKEALVTGPWVALSQTSQTRKATLEEALARLQEIENLLLDFAKRSSKFNIWLDSADEILTDPIVVESVEAVQQLQTSLDEFLASISDKSEEYESIGALAEQIRALGTAENTYSKLSYSDLTNKWTAFQGLIDARKTKLTSELATQEENEKLRVAFAEQAKAFNEWINEKSSAVNDVTGSSKDLEAKLVDATALNTEVQSNAGQYDQVVASNQSLDDALITDNQHTELTIEVLKLRWEKLNNLAKETEVLIQNQILSKKNTDVSADELKEFKECFDHFDKDHNGSLERLELDACLKSLGEDLNEGQLNAVISEYATDGLVLFDQFVQYMVKTRKGSDTPDNIKASFRIMADEKEYITEAQIRSVLPGPRADYLVANMPAFAGVEGGFDYVKFTENLYA
jgi:Ca2+-binding EF-hand superfamily protein